VIWQNGLEGLIPQPYPSGQDGGPGGLFGVRVALGRTSRSPASDLLNALSYDPQFPTKGHSFDGGKGNPSACDSQCSDMENHLPVEKGLEHADHESKRDDDANILDNIIAEGEIPERNHDRREEKI
jgi:hypothetical protein